MRYEPPRSPYLRALPFLLCGVLGFALFITRPQSPRLLEATGVDVGTAGCLSNLNQLSRAFALYAQDFDGRIPRGVDPADRYNPEIWQGSREYGSAFYDDATKTPFLHEVLRPYIKSPEVFHCPADVGWTKSRLPLMQSNLTNVKPSSFQKYGTSYFYFTRYAFNNMRAEDVEEPAQTLLVFDGDLWHENSGQTLLNGLFADGHVQNLSSKQFEYFASKP